MAGRATSYGQTREPGPLDRFGIWLSGRAVRRHAELAGARVADLGCGYHAAFARTLAGRAKSVTVVDVALAGELHDDERIEAIEGTLPDALSALPDGSLDVVIASRCSST